MLFTVVSRTTVRPLRALVYEIEAVTRRVEGVDNDVFDCEQIKVYWSRERMRSEVPRLYSDYQSSSKSHTEIAVNKSIYRKRWRYTRSRGGSRTNIK